MYSYSFEFKLGRDVMGLQYTVGWNAEAFTLQSIPLHRADT